MADGLRWFGDEIKRKLEAEIGRRLDACAIKVSNHTRVLLSVDGTNGGGVRRDAQGRYQRGATPLRYGANPSRPGSPPHVQTGRLRGSIAWERDGLVARVGTAVFYGRILQQNMNRPFLDRALREQAAEVNAILSRPIDF